MIYELEQRLRNVTVEILRDPTTGERSVGWYTQSNTEDITEKENPMTKANQTLIRAEIIDGEYIGGAMRGDPEDLIAMMNALVFSFLEEYPNRRAQMREALRHTFHESRPRLGDLILEKLTKRGVSE